MMHIIQWRVTKKLEQDRGVWILEKTCMEEEFKVLKSSEVQIQGLHGDE